MFSDEDIRAELERSTAHESRDGTSFFRNLSIGKIVAHSNMNGTENKRVSKGIDTAIKVSRDREDHRVNIIRRGRSWTSRFES